MSKKQPTVSLTNTSSLTVASTTSSTNNNITNNNNNNTNNNNSLLWDSQTGNEFAEEAKKKLKKAANKSKRKKNKEEKNDAKRYEMMKNVKSKRYILSIDMSVNSPALCVWDRGSNFNECTSFSSETFNVWVTAFAEQKQQIARVDDLKIPIQWTFNDTLSPFIGVGLNLSKNKKRKTTRTVKNPNKKQKLTKSLSSVSSRSSSSSSSTISTKKNEETDKKQEQEQEKLRHSFAINLIPYTNEQDKAARIEFVTSCIMNVISQYPIEESVVIIEDYAYRARDTQSLTSIAEVSGTMRNKLFVGRRVFFDQSPTAVKKWFTGSGNADKSHMKEVFLRRTKDLINLKTMIPGSWKSPHEDIIDAFAIACGINENLYYFNFEQQ
jgi:Holliday junction resolvasome RuvABC endonuclease subunit